MNLKASLNKSAYSHGENVNVTIDVKNDSRKVVRKIRVSFYDYAVHKMFNLFKRGFLKQLSGEENNFFLFMLVLSWHIAFIKLAFYFAEEIFLLSLNS